ncbi:MAG: GGDEF domain-containing protein, partial [Oscillospiraceae bacterium]
GHIYGDAVITDFANILKTAFRSSDVIGRIGGDEFIVFIKNITHLDQVTEKADEIIRLVHSTYAGQNNEIQLSTSIGISLFPDDGIYYDHLFRTADIALYRSKLVRNTYTVYDFSMRDEAGDNATKTHKTPIDSDNEPVETVAEII